MIEKKYIKDIGTWDSFIYTMEKKGHKLIYPDCPHPPFIVVYEGNDNLIKTLIFITKDDFE